MGLGLCFVQADEHYPRRRRARPRTTAAEAAARLEGRAIGCRVRAVAIAAGLLRRASGHRDAARTGARPSHERARVRRSSASCCCSRSSAPRNASASRVIAIFFLCAAVFWAGFEQQATTFNLFALDFTDRSWLGGLFPERRPSRLVVPVGEPDVHRALRAVLRVDLGRARRAQSRPVRAGQVRPRPRCCSALVPRDGVRRRARRRDEAARSRRPGC